MIKVDWKQVYHMNEWMNLEEFAYWNGLCETIASKGAAYLYCSSFSPDIVVAKTELSFWYWTEKEECPFVKADLTYSCPGISQNSCTKQWWYYDGDGDGKGDPNNKVYECQSKLPQPSNWYVAEGGDECDTVPGVYQKGWMYIDKDGDRYPHDPGGPGYQQCPLKSGGKWDAPAGYCVKCSPGYTFPYCCKEGTKDCNDKDPAITVEKTWVIDKDGDGYYNLSEAVKECYGGDKCFKTFWGTKCAMQQDVEKTSLKPGDCDDNYASINPKTVWVTDKDKDGYYDPQKNKAQCADPGDEYFNKAGPKGSALKEGDCDDNYASINPKTVWVRDKDQDGFYDPQKNKVQCADPGDEYFNKAGPKGSALKKGDCDDDDPVVKEMTYLFADQDADGFGDPMVSKFVDCTQDPQVSDPDEQEFDWVKRPDDLAPHDPGATPQENLEQTDPDDDQMFWVSDNAQFCFMQLQAGAPFCKTPGTAYVRRSNGTLWVMPESFQQKYCPQQSVPYLNPKLPYLTAHPILTLQQFHDLKLPPPAGLFGELVEKCLLPIKYEAPVDAIIQKINVLSPSGHDQYYLALSGTSYYLIPSEGVGYEIQPDTHTETWDFLPPPLPPGASPIVAMEDFVEMLKVFTTVTSLTELEQASRALAHGIPLNVETPDGTVSEACLFKGELFPGEACYHAPSLKGSALRGFKKPSDLLRYLNDVTDTDGDGVTDILEMGLPGLTYAQGVQAANNPQLFLNKGYDPATPHLTYPLDPAMEILWKMAQGRAEELIPIVYERTAEVMENVPNVVLTLSPEQWKAMISLAQPRMFWTTKLDWASTHPRYPLIGGERAYGVTFPELHAKKSGVPDKIMCQVYKGAWPGTFDPATTPIYVDIWNIVKEWGAEKAMAKTADTILHEILHTHICFTPKDDEDQQEEQDDLEHAFIYGITGESLLFDCGTFSHSY